MIGRIKKFLYRNAYFIFFCSIFIILLFMANGYSILKTRLNVSGVSNIDYKIEDVWKPKVKYKMTKQMGDVFFYDIVIYNDTEIAYQNWELKIFDTGYISFPLSFGGEKQGDYWVLNNSNWDKKIDSKGKLIITITIQISENLPDSMTKEEYAQYFVENYVTFSGTNTGENIRDGDIITNGNATLTLRKDEEKLTTFSIEEDKEYSQDEKNEKQYIITINNDTDNDFVKLRGNIYMGEENALLEVSPSEITCQSSTNATFEMPTWFQVYSKAKASFYIIIKTTEKNFIPEVVMAITK